MSEIFKTTMFDRAEQCYYKRLEKDSWYWLFNGVWEVESHE